MSDFQQQRLERVMDPERRNTLEAKGVLSPASVCGPSGEHYLSPRLDAEGNYSHITCVGPLGRYVLMSTACAKNRLRIALAIRANAHCRQRRTLDRRLVRTRRGPFEHMERVK
jgi:hypothetical protein